LFNHFLGTRAEGEEFVFDYFGGIENKKKYYEIS
jgi:hypothetical protein